MPKPDLKGKNNKGHPTVRIRFECDRRVTVLPHTFNASVMNLLAKQTHDDESVSWRFSCWTGVLVLAKGRRSGNVGKVCIKEDETDCEVGCSGEERSETVRKNTEEDAW
jgi:hypothetical protein